MKKVLSFLGPYRFAVFIALFFTFTELVVELIQPYLIGKIIDDGIMQEDLSVVVTWGSIMLVLSLVAFASGILNSFYAAHASQNTGYDLRSRLFEKVQSFSFANFSQYPTSSLITRMSADVTLIQNALFMALRIMLRAPLLVFGSVIMALFVNVRLALILVVAVPLLILFLLFIMRHAGKMFRAVQEKLDNVNSVMQENLVGIRLIKAFLRRKHESNRFTKASGELRDRTVTALRLLEIGMPIILLIMNISIMAVLWFGSFHVETGGATVGEVVTIVNYTTRMTAAMSIFSMIIMFFSRARASATRIADVIETEVDLLDTEQSSEKNVITRGKLTFDRVSFTYPNSETDVLHELSFEAKPGERIAILGATGSGKTTLFQLIPRLYDIEQGKILIDDIDIRDIKLNTLRRQIGFVPQEAMLFSGTIKDNLAWGKEDATLDEMIEATKHAQIYETIESLPNQFNTILGQRGVNLSGGQKQRLSIARALIRKPKILLLDDSTSALDVKTEKKLLDALEHYECTTLLITQKISTSMNADMILLLEDGELLATGTHEELLATSELYKKIYVSQFGED
ncbi:ABC transporter ATP-binding protein [Evansella cellulosilytica]|uniref:ABC transporter related protein n=1 Tax=Evansella cellulosilytica (strain ATCC 21833 / DSM 2522 / FERM P-1141 / JCM 9156 / N-4) TaxID=649639 RepID=E6U008_EVAC2|nr:ABC transporter ATP-binding protein [Evansella cellulosilytica]ADU29012.1 ABC transporter related protein [Evansella cellulosilytica DSM 2522]